MTPQDRRALARADVLVVNGLGLESFLGEPGRVSQLMKPGSSVIDISSRVGDLLADDEDDHADHGKNPHTFASPSMMARMAVSLADQLAEADPEHSALYRAQRGARQNLARRPRRRLRRSGTSFAGPRRGGAAQRCSAILPATRA